MDYETLHTRQKIPSMVPVRLARLEAGATADAGPVGVFRLFYLPSGSGMVRLRDEDLPWFSPSVICVNERETLAGLAAPEGTILFAFNPLFLNLALEYCELRKPQAEMPPAVVQNKLLMWPFVERTDRYRGVIDLGPEDAMFVADKLEGMDREVNGQPSGWWPCRTRALLTEVLFQLAQTQVSAPSSTTLAYSGITGKARDILGFLCEHYREKITLPELAARFGTNRTTLNQWIKQATGLPVNAYVIELRLRKAALFLSDTMLPVSEVAERIGIEDQSNFIRLFKKKYLSAPGEFRKSHNARAT